MRMLDWRSSRAPVLAAAAHPPSLSPSAPNERIRHRSAMSDGEWPRAEPLPANRCRAEAAGRYRRPALAGCPDSLRLGGLSLPYNRTRRQRGQLIEQRLRLLQVRRVEALGEPAVDRGEQVARLGPPRPGRATAGRGSSRRAAPTSSRPARGRRRAARRKQASASAWSGSGRASSSSPRSRCSSASIQRAPVRLDPVQGLGQRGPGRPRLGPPARAPRRAGPGSRATTARPPWPL